MCGIVGLVNLTNKPVSAGLVERMQDAMIHRGPDDKGLYVAGNIGLGHRRLSIIDLSEAGRQPMSNEDKTVWLVYNGEIYNFKELRKDLKSLGHKFNSRTDAEVVIHAYEEWREACLHRFNGMFAFAIWDSKENKLLLARDRYGIKPLYYWFQSNTIVFASEIKAILLYPDIKKEVCIPALNEYFSFQNIFSDLTLFKEIKLLPAASYITVQSVQSNPFQQQRYWDYHFSDEESYGTEAEYVEELSRLFEQAVNRQLVSDVEVGAYLSGGMDSGSITCIAAKNFKNLKTFTTGFDLSSASGMELGFDEREKAEYLSNLYKTEHYEVVLKAGDMERVMKDLAWHLEDPRVGQCYPNYYVARLASKFVKVVLSGAGGDELFAGYPWRYYRAAVNINGDQYAEKYYRYWQRLIPDRYKPKFYQPDIYPEIGEYQTKDVFRSVIGNKPFKISTPEEYINRSLYLEIKTFLHGLLEVEDKLSMAHSLETRVPFLDNDLVDFAMKIPVKYKLKNLTDIVRLNENEPGPKTKKYFGQTNDGKIILRKVLSKYVPFEYTESTKQGFSAPDASWFKGESIDYIKKLLFDKKAKIYSYIQSDFAQKLMNEHFSGQTNRRLLIWSLLSFEWWLRIFLDEQYPE